MSTDNLALADQAVRKAEQALVSEIDFTESRVRASCAELIDVCKHIARALRESAQREAELHRRAQQAEGTAERRYRPQLRELELYRIGHRISIDELRRLDAEGAKGLHMGSGEVSRLTVARETAQADGFRRGVEWTKSARCERCGDTMRHHQWASCHVFCWPALSPPTGAATETHEFQGNMAGTDACTFVTGPQTLQRDGRGEAFWGSAPQCRRSSSHPIHHGGR